jgi:thiol-disulfide isomerase/thioredoxin
MTDWCTKCQTIEPHLNKLALTHSSKAKFFLINIDTNIETASEYDLDDASKLPKLLCFKGDYKTSESIDGNEQIKYISFVEEMM